MICKNCEKELPEGSVQCCYCGASLEEEAAVQPVAEEAAVEQAPETVSAEPAPKNKANVWIVILAIVAGVALLTVLAGAILQGLGINPIKALTPRANDVLYKDNYYVEDDAARENTDLVVASIGDETLTVGELQIYYWESVYNFLSENYYYLASYGLDTTKPLNEQACALADGQTWQQFFLEVALSTWQRYTTLQILARDEGYQVAAEMQSFLDGLPESMQRNATTYGFDSVIAWLESNCGPGVSESGYLEYVTAYYEGTFYVTDHYDNMSPSQEEVEAYFTAHENEFTESGLTRDSGKYYDVRHILIELQGGVEDETGKVVYSEEDWAACLKKAQDVLDEWKNGTATEEDFAKLAMRYSADGGSSTNGGLYEDLTAETNFVQEFKDWYLDETRKPGDTGLVKSVYGYHIMYFSGAEDIWYAVATQEAMAEKITAFIDAGIEKYPMEVNYKKIVLGDKEIN